MRLDQRPVGVHEGPINAASSLTGKAHLPLCATGPRS